MHPLSIFIVFFIPSQLLSALQQSHVYLRALSDDGLTLTRRIVDRAPYHLSLSAILSSSCARCLLFDAFAVAVWLLKVRLQFAAPPLFNSGSSRIRQSGRRRIIRSSCLLAMRTLGFCSDFQFLFRWWLLFVVLVP